MSSFDAPADLLTRARAALGEVILGHTEALDLALAAVASGGHVLIEDRPGVGKTTLARSLAALFGLDMTRIQGTSDLLPTDITGVHVYEPATATWVYRRGPVLSQLVLIDELNRATPKAQSALLEAMAERQVSVDGETFAMPDPHVVVATQNPYGEAGTHRLVQAQLDRFAVCIRLGLPERATERRLLRSGRRVDAEAVGTPEDLVTLRSMIAAQVVDDTLVEYTLDVVDALRRLEGVWLSVRVPLVLLDVARGLAALDGRDFVAPDDVRLAAPAVVRHRLGPHVDDATVERTITDVIVPS